jgi:hypothetical protein
MKKKLPYKCFWQAELLNRKVRKDAVPIDVSLFKRIKGSIGLLGYRRIIKEGQEHLRIYRKDTYGTTFIFINLEESSVEAKTETWTGLTGICSEFDLIPYRRA